MDHLLIRLKKRCDGPAVLTCIRPDDSATWHDLHPAFPVHDLTHFAVESVLGLRDGFFGLIGQGWDIEEFDKPWPRGPLPPEAIWTEFVVGLVWQQCLTRQEQAPAELRATLCETLATRGAPHLRDLSDGEIDQIRFRLREFVTRWEALPAGEMLELSFPLHARKP